MVQWFARREDISMKMFTDSPLQEVKTEFVIAKLWCSSKATICSAARKNTQLRCGQCTWYSDIRMKFANDREMALLSPQSPFHITPRGMI